MAGVVQTGSDGPIALVAPASSITPAFDAPPQPHDLLVAWVYASGAAGTLSTPPGWTKIGEANGGLNAAPLAPYSPPHAPGSDPAPPLPPPLAAGPAPPRPPPPGPSPSPPLPPPGRPPPAPRSPPPRPPPASHPPRAAGP